MIASQSEAAFRYVSLFAIGSLSGLLLFLSPAHADDGFSDKQKEEVRKIIKEYIHEHPSEIIDAYREDQEKAQEKMRAAADIRVKDNYQSYAGKEFPSAGNPDGDVTIVEFFDYHCGYCKKAFTDVKSVLDSDKKVRFVFRELPILSPQSEVAARWSLAAHKQGKYFEFHSALMDHSGMIDNSVLEKAAKDLGLDLDRLKKDADSEEIKEAVAKDRTAAQDISISGTPGFIINGKVFRGYLGEQGLKKAIEDARKGKAG